MANRRVEEHTIQKAKFFGGRTSSLLEFIYRTDGGSGVDREGANLVMSQMGGDPDLKLAILFDVHNRVSLATDYELRGQPLEAVFLTEALHCHVLIDQVRTTLAGQVEVTHEKHHVHAFYPVRFPAKSNELRSSQIGALVLVYDLLELKRAAKQDAAWRALQTSGVLVLLCAIAWLFFERTVTRRARHLVEVTNHRAHGNLSERAHLQGADELAQIGAAFNHMADQLKQASETALWQRNTLLQTISEAQTQFITAENHTTIFDGLLSSLLELTNSEYSFIGEVHIQTDGSATMENSLLKFRGIPSLQAHDIMTTIPRNPDKLSLPGKKPVTGMTFTNIKTLLGEVIMTENPVIDNTLKILPIQGKTLIEHPSLNTFLGIPFFSSSQLIGIVGIANRPDGYDDTIIEFLQPFLTTCSNLIEGCRLERQKQEAETARHDAEKQIAKQLMTIEAAADGIAILEGDRYQYLNQAHVEIFGYETAEELIGQSWRRLYSPEEIKRFEQTIFPILQRKRVWQGEAIATRKDGSAFAQGVSLTLTDDDLLICVCQDISARKASQAALHNLSTRLRLAVKSGGIGIWEWNFIHERLTWDNRMCELYGTSPAAFTGLFSEWSSRVHPEDITNAQEQFQQVIANKHELDIEFRVIHANGQVLHIKANGLMQYDDDDNPVRMIGINIDISDRKKAEAEILKALKQERELNEMKSRFVSNTSHEFRTPLTVISNNAELLKLFGDKLDETEKQKCLDTILNYVEHTTELIDDVLVVSRAEAGKLILNPKALNVVEFSQHLVQTIGMSAPQYHFACVVQDKRSQALNDNYRAQLDSKILQQSLTNLLTNAIKYSPLGSTITLQLELLSTQIEFRVIDEGLGIPEEDQKYLFEPFHRAKNVGTIPGTGLGLSIVKRLITLHQGSISVTSAPEEGSCFTINIPTQWQ